MMEDKKEMQEFIENLPERALLPYFLALMKIAKESVVISVTKRITEFLSHVFAWFVMGLGITGIIWLMVVIFISIRGMI